MVGFYQLFDTHSDCIVYSSAEDPSRKVDVMLIQICSDENNSSTFWRAKGE